jgi:hypothetical protein
MAALIKIGAPANAAQYNIAIGWRIGALMIGGAGEFLCAGPDTHLTTLNGNVIDQCRGQAVERDYRFAPERSRRLLARRRATVRGRRPCTGLNPLVEIAGIVEDTTRRFGIAGTATDHPQLVQRPDATRNIGGGLLHR